MYVSLIFSKHPLQIFFTVLKSHFYKLLQFISVTIFCIFNILWLIFPTFLWLFFLRSLYIFNLLPWFKYISFWFFSFSFNFFLVFIVPFWLNLFTIFKPTQIFHMMSWIRHDAFPGASRFFIFTENLQIIYYVCCQEIFH